MEKTKNKILPKHEGFALKYITLKNIPVRDLDGHEVFDSHYHDLEVLVARTILKRNVPLRGLELIFLRSVADLTLEDLGNALGFSKTAVHKWEAVSNRRLSRTNEILLKTFFFKKFGLPVPEIEEMVSVQETPKEILVDVAAPEQREELRVRELSRLQVSEATLQEIADSVAERVAFRMKLTGT